MTFLAYCGPQVAAGTSSSASFTGVGVEHADPIVQRNKPRQQQVARAAASGGQIE
eukprot:CAMPEP_0170308704 /NCGR_PEP_ID=MMETSP0116_2-20130129/54798_1 /TAXON_ID=400756 /ORGANISM="Durinskia baltica, Strain CSIRO CS-38" /LENGTH=54 /DNA_ID=CAMNT_0010560899 /DNA_START=32 /DNA_END=194 /DNA_ORIENTATION=-